MAILLRERFPAGAGVVWFAVPNGGLRNIRTAKRLKEQGVRAGVADLIIYGRGVALALELKTPKGRASEDQDGFRAAWEAAGGRYRIARSLREVRAILWDIGLF